MAPSAKKNGRPPKRGDTLHLIQPAAMQLPLPPPFSQHGESAEMIPPPVLTIGHSNHEPDDFLALLRQHGVTTLLDVRSAPYSRYAPHFNRDRLDALLTDAEIAYVWAGEALGGRPDDPACYREGIVLKGKVDYAAVAQRPWYQDGVRQLLDTAARGPTAIMCSEEDPRRCHRHHLIEATLRDRGVDVLHIRRDGSLETIELEEAGLPDEPSPQLALLGMDA